MTVDIVKLRHDWVDAVKVRTAMPDTIPEDEQDA